MTQDLFSDAKPIDNLRQVIETELPKGSLDSTNTLWATSVCSDEVNQSLHQLDKYFRAFGPFILGGISGIPFAGKTGFKAFASHIPDNGGAVVIYGPHIGITKDGELGKVNREGQDHTSSCCGSLVAGLTNVKSGNVLNVTHDDYQQGQVNKVIIENFDDIENSDNDIIATTNVAFKQIKRELTDIISGSLESLDGKPLLMIGGVIINTDWDQEDLFEVRD
ncbi:MAG TPA: hypothetical protein VJ941_09355, partial [Gracilimonas sp.]|nr:hypothetical protein [Gracilimonas sp.]